MFPWAVVLVVVVGASALVLWLVRMHRRREAALRRELARLAEINQGLAELRRAEEELRATEQRFAEFMQHLPGLAWIKDLEGRYVYANDAATKAFRRRREDLYGKTDDDLFPPATARQFQENDRQALASGTGSSRLWSATRSRRAGRGSRRPARS